MEFLKISGNDELFVLFHGTGGNDFSLLNIAERLNPQASVLSFLGNVGSGHNRRFFAPLRGDGVDKKDLDMRVENFIKQWNEIKKEYKDFKIIFVGYSNGANFILALLERVPDIADRTILLHPSDLGFKFKKVVSKNKVLIAAGAKDMIASPGKIIQMINKIKEHEIFEINYILGDGGHEITDEEIEKAKEYI